MNKFFAGLIVIGFVAINLAAGALAMYIALQN